MLGMMLMAAQAATAMPAFLTGCWEHRAGEQWSQECWTDPRAGQMMGSSRSGKAGSIAFWEFMRIEAGADGTIAFFASPKGAPATRFTARRSEPGLVEFVDPGHDYPQRITYRLDGDLLRAEISLIDGSKPTRWLYRRAGSKSAGQPTISSSEKK